MQDLDPASVEWCLKLVKRYPEFRMSVQLHKMLGVE